MSDIEKKGLYWVAGISRDHIEGVEHPFFLLSWCEDDGDFTFENATGKAEYMNSRYTKNRYFVIEILNTLGGHAGNA